MLHIINQSKNIQRCLQSMQKNDVILLIQDGVIAALKNSELMASNILCYALEEDVIARGLQDQMSPQIKLINYAQFVELTLQHHPILSWS